MVMIVSRMVVAVHIMHLVCMIMLVTMGLLASTSSKERCCTQAGE